MQAIRLPMTVSLALACLAAFATVVAAQEQVVRAEPKAFTATWFAEDLDQAEGWSREGIDPEHEINGRWQFGVMETSDERIDGQLVYSYNIDRFRANDLELHHSSLRIEGDEGAWQETPAVLLGYPDLSPSTRTGVFVGEDAYAGLVAIAELRWDRSRATFDVRGFIIDGGLPPLPGEGVFPE